MTEPMAKVRRHGPARWKTYKAGIVTARTRSETMPRMWEGNNLWKGNRNPVTLVAAVVMRNVAVQPLDCFADSSAKTTTKPARIPTRLNATWKRVNTARPELMGCLLNWNLLASIPPAPKNRAVRFLGSPATALLQVPRWRHCGLVDRDEPSALSGGLL